MKMRNDFFLSDFKQLKGSFFEVFEQNLTIGNMGCQNIDRVSCQLGMSFTYECQ